MRVVRLMATAAAVVVSLMAPAAAATVPTAPRSVTAGPTTSSVKITWVAPSSTGGSPITAYRVQRFDTLLARWSTIASTGASARSYADVQDAGSPIVAGRTYKYRVRARNAIGWGPVSSAVTVTPFLATAPRALTATAEPGQIDLAWQAPSADGGTPITAYVVQRATSASWATIATLGGSARAYTDTAVVLGTRYSYRVRAQNTAGLSPVSASASNAPACPANPEGVLVVNATLAPNSNIEPTGVSDPVACAFHTITDAIAAANQRASDFSTAIYLVGGTAANPAVFDHESFPLVLPGGINLISDATDPAAYRIEFTGTAGAAIHGYASEVRGITIENHRDTAAKAMVWCKGKATYLNNVVLTGAPGGAPIDRGAWAWAGCALTLDHTTVKRFAGDGVLIDNGSSLAVDGATVRSNGGNGITVRGNLASPGVHEATQVAWNQGDGVQIQQSDSAVLLNWRVFQNGGNGVEVHPSKFDIDYSWVANNSRDGSWDQPQLLFVGEAAPSSPLWGPDPDQSTWKPSYVVGPGLDGASFQCPTITIAGYDQSSPDTGTVGIRAEDGASVIARLVAWQAGPRVTMSAGSQIDTSSPCASVGSPALEPEPID